MMQPNVLVVCWTNVLKSESSLKTSMPRSLPIFCQNILSNRSSWGTVYGYVIVSWNLLCMARSEEFGKALLKCREAFHRAPTVYISEEGKRSSLLGD